MANNRAFRSFCAASLSGEERKDSRRNLWGSTDTPATGIVQELDVRRRQAIPSAFEGRLAGGILRRFHGRRVEGMEELPNARGLGPAGRRTNTDSNRQRGGV